MSARHRQRGLALAMSALLAGGLASVGAAAPANAARYEHVATAKDPRGDTRMSKSKALTRLEKASIDARRVVIQRAGRDARITVHMRELRRTTKFDQILHVYWAEAADSDRGGWWGEAYATALGEGSAYYASPDSSQFESCDIKTSSSRHSDTIVLRVPYACVPEGPLTIKVQTLAGHYATDAPLYARDRVRIPGRPQVL